MELSPSIAAELERLSIRDSDLVPGKAFDTRVLLDETGVTTQLSPEAVVILDNVLPHQPENDWFRMFLETNDAELAALAASQVASINLVKEACRQAKGPVDHSDDLLRHESELFHYMNETHFEIAVSRKIA